MRDFLANRRVVLLATVAAALSAAALAQTVRLHLASVTGHMFLAPMIGVIEPCILAQPPNGPNADASLAARCSGPQGSAAALVESTLAELAPAGPRA
ncbi:MAG: hypothetical protein ABI919_03400, partial [Ramlibacter sp.]